MYRIMPFASPIGLLAPVNIPDEETRRVFIWMLEELRQHGYEMEANHLYARFWRDNRLPASWSDCWAHWCAQRRLAVDLIPKG